MPETHSAVVIVSVDDEPSFVDDYVMVEPAESDQVFGIGLASLRPGDDVVRLEPVSRIASVGDAPVAITMKDCPA